MLNMRLEKFADLKKKLDTGFGIQSEEQRY